MATINSKIEGVDILGVVTAGETIYVGRATSTQHGIVKPAATDFEFDNQTNAMLIKLGVGLKRTDDGIAIAIYDGNVVTDVLAVKDGLEIKYADIDEETENSKVIPWSEFTTAEIAYIKGHIGDWINIEPGTGEGAVQQIGAKATGPHSAAFGSRRYDKPTDESRRITEAKGGNAFAAGGSVIADGDFTAAFGKETQAEQSASFAAGTKTQAGKTLEEYVAAGGNAEDYAKSYAAAAVFGDGNKAKGYADFVAGNANESDGTSNTTVGGANKVKGTRNFTGGEANEVGQSGSSDVGNALTFGQHLKNTGRWNRVTFGQFNADDLAALLEIGAGTSDNNRVNIFVVKDNGAIYAGKLGKLHQGTRFQVSDGNSESDRRALIDSRHNGVTHIESYMSTLNGSVGNGNKVAASESGELKDIADPTDGNYPLLNTFLAGQGLQNKGRFNQAVFGQFNEFDSLALFQIGTGNSDTDRKKGFRVDYAGRAKSDTAAAGDEFYVRVADLGYEVDFPHGDPTVRCDNTDGITVTGTMRIYLNQAKTVFHDVPNVSVEIPIFAGKNVTIDADETNKKAVVKASDIDVDTLIPLLLGSNGIKLTKNEAGDRLLIGISRLGFELGTFEANGDGIKFAYNNDIAEQIYLGASLGGAIDIYNSLVGIDNYIRVKATADEYIEINNEDVIYHTASGVKHYLREDTVKTIGGQSIYGTGDIPVGGGSVSLPIVFSGESQGMSGSDGSIIDATYTEGYPGAPMIKLKYLDYVNSISPINIYMKQTSSGHTHELYVRGNGIVYVFDDTQYEILREDNVKTLFGNKSIYGSGNIDLYRHSIRFETLYTQTDKGQASFSFEVISSSNIAIDSLTDVFNYLKNRKVPVCGTCSPTGDTEYIAQYIDIVGSSNSYIYYVNNTGASLPIAMLSLSNMDSSLTITDTVTTV